MCGRFVASAPAAVLADTYSVEELGDIAPPRWNVAPTDAVNTVLSHRGVRRLLAVRWGLVPHWSKRGAGGPPLINARRETVWDKPAFRVPVRRRRCLIPADGWYEWTRPGPQPWFVRSPQPLAFAGVWDTWRPAPGAAPVVSCAIVTGTAPDGLAWLHDRSPVALPPDDWDAWLDPGTAPEEVAHLLRSPTPEVRAVAVGRDVNRVTQDGPYLVEPANLDV